VLCRDVHRFRGGLSGEHAVASFREGSFDERADGVIVFDDYGFTSTPGAKAMADAFFASKPEPLLHLVTAQAIAIKQ
jgi:hypothetical protein